MQRTGDADPTFRRAIGTAAVLLGASYLIFSGVFSHHAPLGNWSNEIFGQPMWGEWDPGGVYVDAAHQLTWGRGQLFEGHPGTTLILLLSGLQHVYYLVAGTASGLSFSDFTARNLPTIFVLSKLMMTTLHLLACLAVFLLARRVLGDRRAAAFSALGYATSLNVGYFLSRISVEPIMVICFVLSVLAVWRYQDAALQGRLGPALGFAALSAVLGVSGVVTKLNFLAPLVPFLALYILVGGWREANDRLVPWRIRGYALLVFSATGLVVFGCYSQLIDWGQFFKLWIRFASQSPHAWDFAKLLPSFAPEGIFLTCELAYVTLGAAGWWAFLRDDPEHRMRALWISAYGFWGLLLFGYRITGLGHYLGFHYFHLSSVVFSIFFGYAVLLVLRRLRLPQNGWRAASLGSLVVIGVHSMVFWTVFDSRRRDAELYAPNREIHRVIAALKPDQSLGCVACITDPPAARLFPLLYPLSSVGWVTGLDPDARSVLGDAFASIFVLADRKKIEASSDPIRVESLNETLVVVSEPSTTDDREDDQ